MKEVRTSYRAGFMAESLTKVGSRRAAEDRVKKRRRRSAAKREVSLDIVIVIREFLFLPDSLVLKS